MEYEDWKQKIIEYMTKGGWNLDRDNETTLGFQFPEGDALWIRDYDKKTRRFVQFNGNQKINLLVKKMVNGC